VIKDAKRLLQHYRPEADMPLVLANVCFGGMSGHQNAKALFPLLIQVRHDPVNVGAVQNNL
jgi:hypothetical protein